MKTQRTTRQRLTAAGLTTRKAAGNYRKTVLQNGKPVFEGTAYEVSLWLDRKGVAP